MLQQKNERYTMYLALLLLTLFVLPLYLLGEQAHIRVHDNLDSNIAWYKVIKESGQLFGHTHAMIPQVSGVPRNAYGTEYSLLVWLHYFLPSMIAYAISQTIVRYFAFFGMYVLLRDFIMTAPQTYWIRIGCALLFAFTPFWPSGMLSTLGHPLALWAFLHIRAQQGKWCHWVILILLPLYSSFALGFFFFLFAVFCVWLWDVWHKKKIQLTFLISIVLMTLLYLLVDYRFVYSLLYNGMPTSRDAFVSSTLTASQTIRLIAKNFIFGHTHVRTVHTYVILPIIMLGLWIAIKDKKGKENTLFFGLFIFNILLSVWYGFWFYKGLQPLKETFHFLNTFNFARFHFLRPLVLYILFALALFILTKRQYHLIAKFALIAQLSLLIYTNEEWYYRRMGTPSFEQFYATRLFTNIADYIGKPKESYRVGSIGLHPAIAQYNGFYTIDTYNNFYSLSYKHTFRTIIATELAKNKQLRSYFDTWGGRRYLFVDELGKRYDFRAKEHRSISNLQLHVAALQQEHTQYIFSSVEITNATLNHLRLLRIFTDSKTVWRIYLYEVQGE